MKNVVVVLVLGFCTLVMNAQEQEKMRTFDPEFAHTVYFWFHEPDNTNHSALFEKSLKTFLKNSKYAKTNFIGKPPKATRDVVDGSFTYSLIVTFASAEAQQKYLQPQII